MVASENTELFAWYAHWFSNRSDIPDKALQPPSCGGCADRDCGKGVADGFYAISSLVLLGTALGALRTRAGLSTFLRQATAVEALTLVAAVAFLLLLSIQFASGPCINPSRAHPYFTPGRLLNGALIPFALLYVYGTYCLLRRISAALPLIGLGVIVAFVTTSEIFINRVVFASEHNWFHL